MLKSFNKLNGWQRLCLVLSVVYFFVVGFFTVAFLPNPSQYFTSRVNETIQLMIDKEPKLSGWSVYRVRKAYRDLSDDELLRKIHKNDKIDFSSIEQEYKKRMSDLPYKRAKVFGLGFLVWIVPSVLLYVFGLAVDWIIRGFRKDKE